MHDREGDQRADHTVGSSGKYQKWFHCIVELNEQRQVNPNQRNHQNNFQIAESVYLFCPFATNPELITRWEIFLEFLHLWKDLVKHLRGENARLGITKYGNRAKMLTAPDAPRFQRISGRRD